MKVTKNERRALREFLLRTSKAQPFALYLGIVQAFLHGMVAAGVKNKPIEELATFDTELPNECAINLYNYIKDIHEGRAPAVSLKECLNEKKNKTVK